MHASLQVTQGVISSPTWLHRLRYVDRELVSVMDTEF